MNMLKRRLDATDERLQELKAARKTAAKMQRQQFKQTRADRERKIMLAGDPSCGVAYAIEAAACSVPLMPRKRSTRSTSD